MTPEEFKSSPGLKKLCDFAFSGKAKDKEMEAAMQALIFE